MKTAEHSTVRTVAAVISAEGDVRLLEEVRLPAARRALVTILEDDVPTAGEPGGTAIDSGDTALMSEAALALDWLREEEDEAWAHLQQGAQSQVAGKRRSRLVR